MASTSEVDGLLRTSYDAKGRSCKTSDLYGKPRQTVTVTGIEVAAHVWTQQTANISAAHGDLKPGHYYAIDRVRATGIADPTDGIAQFIRFRHSDFDGCRPGGYIASAVKGQTYLAGGILNPTGGECLDFSEHGKEGMHPVFSSDSPLAMDAVASDDVQFTEYIVEFVDMGESRFGVATCEDVNGCYATCDDAQTFAVATVMAGDSYNVASDRGNCAIKAFEVLGVNAVAGRLSAPVDVLQPNAIVCLRNLAGERTRELRDIPIPRTTTITAELSSYVLPT